MIACENVIIVVTSVLGGFAIAGWLFGAYWAMRYAQLDRDKYEG